MILAFVGKQAVGPSSRMFWLRFPREFSILIRFFVSGVTWSVRASSGALGWKHVVSLEPLRDVTGKALLSSAG